MGSTDFGTQTQSFDFNEAADGENFNKLNYQLHQPGIYDGGALSRVDADTIQVAPLTCYIVDSTTENGVRIITSATVDLDVTSGTNYIILRFDWDNVVANYMDFLAVAFGSVGADDIIIGKAVFFSATLQTTFDYTRQTTGLVSELATNDLELKVQSNNAPDNKVYVNGGTIRGVHDIITVTGAASGAVSGTTDGRIDLVWIDEDGAIQITEGVDNVVPASPDYGSKYVIAEIERGSSRTVIDGNEITAIKPVNNNPLYELALTSEDDGASLIGIWDTASNFAATDVETVLAEIISTYAATTENNGASMIGIWDTAGNYSATDVEAALAEIAGGVYATLSISGATITFIGTNADRYIHFASDAEIKWEEASTAFEVNQEFRVVTGELVLGDGEVGTNASRTIRFASDATILWDEANDRLGTSKPFVIMSVDATQLITKIIPIGNWNMQGTPTVSVAHGIGASYKNIRSVQVIVRNDADTIYYDIVLHTGGDVSGGINSIDATNISLIRKTGQGFDNTNFNEPSYDRGWIYITYEI